MNPTLYLHRSNDELRIARAATEGIGIEVDVRSLGGRLCLSHDPIRRASPELLLEDRLAHFPGPVILDFKESGLIDLALEALDSALIPLERAFAADLIVPDMIRAERLGLRTLARRSKYERISGPFHGYWLDFVERPCDLRLQDKPTFLVSPELHGWTLSDVYVADAVNLGFTGVCTDFPERWNHDRRRDQQRTPSSSRAA